MHRLRPEGLDFLRSAPRQWRFSNAVRAAPADVFAAISADPSTWTAWFPGLSAGHYEGGGVAGIGSGREVRVGGAAYRETVIAWDAPHRWAYRVDETSVPMARALVEEWLVEPGPSEGHSLLTWTFAIDPRPLFRLSQPVAGPVMGWLMRRAARNLSRHLAG